MISLVLASLMVTTPVTDSRSSAPVATPDLAYPPPTGACRVALGSFYSTNPADDRAPRMPIAISMGPADWGTTASPCAWTGFLVDVRANARIETSNFYGTLQADANVLLSWAPSTRAWFSASVDVFRFQFSQNASLIATQMTAGPLTLTGNAELYRAMHFHLSGSVRVLLPLELGRNYSVRSGIEPGLSALWVPHQRVSIVSGLSLPLSLSFASAAPGDVRVSAVWNPRLSLDVGVTIAKAFDVLAGLEVRLSTHPSGALEYVAPRVALRLSIGRVGFVQLASMFPLGGTERSLFRASLAVGGMW